MTSNQFLSGFKEIIMSIYCKNDYFAVAYYSFFEKKLYYMNKFTDYSKDCVHLIKVVQEIEPFICLINFNVSNNVKDTLIETISELLFTKDFSDDEELILEEFEKKKIEDQINHSFEKLVLLTFKYYNLDRCKILLSECSFEKNLHFDDTQKQIYICSLFNTADVYLMKAIGSLLEYILVNKIGEDLNNSTGKLVLNDIERHKSKFYVHVDQTTLNELDIISKEDYPSCLKKNSFKKESLSLFSLFNKCKSKVGSSLLRKIFYQPLSDIYILHQRLDAIELLLKNIEFINQLKPLLKYIKPVDQAIKLMKITTLSYKKFIDLTKTFEYSLAIFSIINNSNLDIYLFNKIKEFDKSNFLFILNELKKTINFENKNNPKSIVINYGVNEKYDEMRTIFSNKSVILDHATSYENIRLEQCLKECNVIYDPVLGFLLEVEINNLKNNKLTKSELNDVIFVYLNNGYKYFKTELMKNLDNHFGKIFFSIGSFQKYLLMKLQNDILEKIGNFPNYLKLIGEIDCLLAFVKIAKNNNFVKPKFNFQNKIIIKDGRHPLKEISLKNFVSNDYISTNEKSINLITGANSSGKTIYLKQNCLIIYMAYLGSYVPAKECNIPLFNQILTKIGNYESISIGISSFTNDLCRLSTIFNKLALGSLVVIDEFGKGTNYNDALSILAACTNYLTDKNTNGHIVISTHINSVFHYIKNQNLISFKKFEIVLKNNVLEYTYQLTDGFCTQSFADELATFLNLDKSLIDRNKEIKKTKKLKNLVVYDHQYHEKIQTIQKIVFEFKQKYLKNYKLNSKQ